MFTGSIPALVTPFTNGSVDETAFRALIDWQIENGSSALVPCGTTGEAPTLSNDEHHRIIAICVEQAAGRVPVIAGCGSNDTQTALFHLEFAQQAGADAALCVVPYYNKPSQEGLFAHFSYLVEKCDIPIVLYNVPGRTVADILPETVARLAHAFPKTILAIKDASGDLARLTDHRMAIGTQFCQLSGNDELAFPYMFAGGHGCISVTANVAPKLCADFQAACAAGNRTEAMRLNDLLQPLHYAMFADTSPGPAKYALSRVRDGFNDETRLPIIPCNQNARDKIDAALKHAGLV